MVARGANPLNAALDGAATGFLSPRSAIGGAILCLSPRYRHVHGRAHHPGCHDHSAQAAGGAGQPCGPHPRQDARCAHRPWHPGKTGQDAGLANLAMDLPMGRARFRRDDQPRQGLPRRAGREVRHRDPRGRVETGELGRHPQISGANRRRARGRGGLYPRGRPRHALRELAGRLYPHLFLLPHRHPETGAQPDRRRNHRSGDDGAR